VAVHLAQWRSARAVRAVAMRWCQNDVEGYAGAGLRSLVSPSDPPTLIRWRERPRPGKACFCVLALEAEACAGGPALARWRVYSAWCGRLQPVSHRPLAHQGCPAGSSCLMHDEDASAAGSSLRLVEEGAMVTSEEGRDSASSPTRRTSRLNPQRQGAEEKYQ
jgi:hypothetical protein